MRSSRLPAILMILAWASAGSCRSLSRRSLLDSDRICGAATLRRNCDMETSLTVDYDKTGDILYLGKTKPYPE
jgi:hypothetical protein